MINLFLVYELEVCSRNLYGTSTLGDCLFGAMKLTKNVGPDEYRYSDYSIGFDPHLQFLGEMLLLLLSKIVYPFMLIIEKKIS